MKIYHKKNFAAGVILAAIGLISMIYGAGHGFTLNSGLVLLYSFGGGIFLIVRSLSRRLSRDDKVNERDERNQAIRLKSKALAHDIMLWVGLAAALVLALCNGKGSPGPCVYIAVGVFFTCCAGFIIQNFAQYYYHEHE